MPVKINIKEITLFHVISSFSIEEFDIYWNFSDNPMIKGGVLLVV